MLFQGIDEHQLYKWLISIGYECERPLLTPGLHEYSKIVFRCPNKHTRIERIHRMVIRHNRPRKNIICDECADRPIRAKQLYSEKEKIKYSRSNFVKKCREAGDIANPLIYVMRIVGEDIIKVGKLGVMPLSRRRELIKQESGYDTEVIATYSGFDVQVHFAEVALQTLLMKSKQSPSRAFPGSQTECYKQNWAMALIYNRLIARRNYDRLFEIPCTL